MRRYDKTTIIDAIREWNELFGEPPVAEEWNGPAIRQSRGHTERYESTGRQWPSVVTVRGAFGSWKAALKAAGVQRKPPTHCRRGHPLKGNNVYVDPQGYRTCLTCQNLSRFRTANRRAVARKAALTQAPQEQEDAGVG